MGASKNPRRPHGAVREISNASALRGCDVPGCPVQVPAGKSMCRRHWQQVPLALQKALYAAYDDLLEGEDLSVVRAYKEVRDACVDAILRGRLAAAHD